MGIESVWPLLFKFSGPGIIKMTVASSYNIVDAVFVGRLSADACHWYRAGASFSRV